MIVDTFKQESKDRWLDDYKKLLDKEKKADHWMASKDVTDQQKEAELLRYKCEILDALDSYRHFFRAINMKYETI